MCVCVGSFFVSMCPQLVPSRPFFIVWGLGDGFVNDTAGKAISAEGAITFPSAVACGRRYSLWVDDAFVVFSDDLGHIFRAAVV